MRDLLKTKSIETHSKKGTEHKNKLDTNVSINRIKLSKT